MAARCIEAVSWQPRPALRYTDGLSWHEAALRCHVECNDGAVLDIRRASYGEEDSRTAARYRPKAVNAREGVTATASWQVGGPKSSYPPSPRASERPQQRRRKSATVRTCRSEEGRPTNKGAPRPWGSVSKGAFEKGVFASKDAKTPFELRPQIQSPRAQESAAYEKKLTPPSISGWYRLPPTFL